jgi:hypothetical protein
LKIPILWDVAPHSLVEICQRFGGAYCMHHQGDVRFHTGRRENLKSHELQLFNIKAVYT